MKNIIGYEKYEGGEIRPLIMYSGTNFKCQGSYDYEIYGQAKCNLSGLLIQGRRRGHGLVDLTLKPNACIVFWRVPSLVKHPEYDPVPDVPEYADEATQHINYLISQYLEKLNIPTLPKYQEYEEDLDEDEEEIPISTFSLVDHPAKRRESETTDSNESVKLETTPNQEEVVDEDNNAPADSVEKAELPDSGALLNSKA